MSTNIKEQTSAPQQASVKQLMGTKILSEANDLKRTIGALATEIDIDETHLKEVIKGNCSMSEMLDVVNRMGKNYPIDTSDFYFVEDDCTDGIRLMRAEESAQSGRIFDRADRTGDRTPYYDYRDTAMSRLGPFKPEWIKELRVVDDADPENPDVAYNNGHFLHQMTFFIGPVNFYWEVNGKKYCREMNTGDSNYITPFWPHSFTSRDPNQLALIMAVTFGGDVRRAQKDLYGMGLNHIRNYQLDMDHPSKATAQLIRQHMANEKITTEILKALVEQQALGLDIDQMLAGEQPHATDDLAKLATVLNVEISDLLVRDVGPDQEVIVRHKSEQAPYLFPSDASAQYRMHPLARCGRVTLLRGVDVEVLKSTLDRDHLFKSTHHSFIYNYGDAPATFGWENEGEAHDAVLAPGDSAYVKPNVAHGFANADDAHANILMVTVGGGVNISTQKELSYFADIDRVIESKCWFD